MRFSLILVVLLSSVWMAWSNPMHHQLESLFERYEPWRMRYREEQEGPQIFIERNRPEMPQVVGSALLMNGTTESTSTEQFSTITTLFYG
ncbi:uncharacterized protein CEXT_121541 [Caerostris extrusa]|uniref:Uncharacterized protein n=1 Tax=Caerostris extrusa TaxID=172846 RepID=A0AAV4RJS3_CAEEX|nr:uncharacterized protein CEXT_121541 [Caerostris extrusa]